ncbi:MAG TPA: MOSC domain-containing protein [Anaerolineales bacterium]|nr:MOSC domain-containing protein [Anaerolineales bacterium]
MKLISINIGQERTLQRKDRTEQTGIFKLPVTHAVMVTTLGLDGDVVMDKKNHGGVDQAVYVYGAADYAWWSRELGKDIFPGTFGENLTIAELESAQFNIGDYLHVGDMTLQVTAPRIPCKTFAARMEDPYWVKRFRYAERPGLYCRVLKEGSVRVSDSVTVESYAGETISILQSYREYYIKDKTEEMIRRQLHAPIDIRSRKSLQEELQQLLESAN